MDEELSYIFTGPHILEPKSNFPAHALPAPLQLQQVYNYQGQMFWLRTSSVNCYRVWGVDQPSFSLDTDLHTQHANWYPTYKNQMNYKLKYMVIDIYAYIYDS